MPLRPLLLLLLLQLSAFAVVVPSQTVWQFDPLSYGYVYNAQERPGAFKHLSCLRRLQAVERTHLCAGARAICGGVGALQQLAAQPCL